MTHLMTQHISNCWRGGAIYIPIAADVNNINVFDLAVNSYGYDGTSPVEVIVDIKAGVTVGSSSTSNPGLRTGVFPNGSTLSVIGSGRIQGRGGNGGNGGGQIDMSGKNADAGGTALLLEFPTTLGDDLEVFGGGGGGGGGSNLSGTGGAGAGGGGGAGTDGGNGGGNGGGSSQNGQTGTRDSGGNGGSGSGSGSPHGGNGGGPGLSGTSGGNSGGNGGPAGKAIEGVTNLLNSPTADIRGPQV